MKISPQTTGARIRPCKESLSRSLAKARFMPKIPAKIKVIQSNPGPKFSASKLSGSKAKWNIRITNNPKISMEVRTSLVRYSVRMSFHRIAPTWLRKFTLSLSQELFISLANDSIVSGQFFLNLTSLEKNPAIDSAEPLLQVMSGHHDSFARGYKGLHPLR